MYWLRARDSKLKKSEFQTFVFKNKKFLIQIISTSNAGIVFLECIVIYRVLQSRPSSINFFSLNANKTFELNENLSFRNIRLTPYALSVF